MESDRKSTEIVLDEDASGGYSLIAPDLGITEKPIRWFLVGVASFTSSESLKLMYFLSAKIFVGSLGWSSSSRSRSFKVLLNTSRSCTDPSTPAKKCIAIPHRWVIT
jgi:hypothetical protein